MEKVTLDSVKEFIGKNYLAFKPSHKRLCLPIINRMCRKMAYGLKFDDIKVSEDLVIDGHHRYISAQITMFNIGNVPSFKTSATAEFNWSDVIFDENDWDTASKIRLLNETDARLNNIDLKTINRIIGRLNE